MLVANVSATPAAGGQPQVGGSVELSGGSIALIGIDTVLQDLQATIGLANTQATVARLTGQSNKGGSVSVTGNIGYGKGGTLDLAAKLSSFTIDEGSRQGMLAKQYNSSVRGKISGNIAITGPLDEPLIATGAPLQLADGSLVIPSRTPETSGQPSALPIDPHFAVDVQLGTRSRPMVIGNSFLHAKAAGPLQLRKRLSAPDITANLNLYSGDIRIPTVMRFSGVGTVDLHYPSPSPDPVNVPGPIMSKTVDVVAVANVPLTQAELAATAPAAPGGTGAPSSTTLATGAQRAQVYQITAHIVGSLDDPSKLTLDLQSSPGGLTHNQMLAALGQQQTLMALVGGTGTQQAFVQQLQNAFNAVGIPYLLQPFESNLASALGLSSFTVDYAPDQPVQLTLSKRLANQGIGSRFEVTYQRWFGARTPGAVNIITQPPQYSLSLGYDLTNRLQLSVRTDDQHNTTASLQGVLRFW